ncbi:B3/4 domain-containing protein [Acidobacteriota bacterium]
MKFSVDGRIFEKFPGLNIGVLEGKGIDNQGVDKGLLELMRESQESVRQEFVVEMLSQHPKIAAWRKAYSAFGAKPKKYKSSVESLYRMVLKGVDLKHINTIVDVYNTISLKHMVPLGGDDISRVEGDIRLTFAKGDEIFRPLNSVEVEVAKEGEVIYLDRAEVLCRRWNWRECDKTKMTEASSDIVLVVEGLPPVTKEDVREILTDLSHLVVKHCGGESRQTILDMENPELEL